MCTRTSLLQTIQIKMAHQMDLWHTFHFKGTLHILQFEKCRTLYWYFTNLFSPTGYSMVAKHFTCSGCRKIDSQPALNQQSLVVLTEDCFQSKKSSTKCIHSTVYSLSPLNDRLIPSKGEKRLKSGAKPCQSDAYHYVLQHILSTSIWYASRLGV